MSAKARKAAAHERRMERQERNVNMTQEEKDRLYAQEIARKNARYEAIRAASEREARSASKRMARASSGKVYSQKKKVVESSRPTFEVETQDIDADFLQRARTDSFTFDGLSGVEAAELAARLIYLAMYGRFLYRPLPYRSKVIDQNFRQHLEEVASDTYGDILTAYNYALQEYDAMYRDADDDDVAAIYDMDRKIVHQMMTPEEVEAAVKEDARIKEEQARRAAEEALREAEEAARARAEADALEAARLEQLRRKVPTEEKEYKDWLKVRNAERKQRMADLQPLYTTDSKLYWERVGEINAEEARDKEVGLQFKKKKKPTTPTKPRGRR